MSENNFADLTAPFSEKDLSWVVIQAGLNENGEPWAIVAPYVDARAIMDRLDQTVGPENWQDAYDHIGAKGVLAKIGIRINGDWIWKQDGSEETDIEAFKGGISKAFVRAAVKWGIGRYLYNLDVMYGDFNKVTKKTPGAIYVSIKKDKNDKFGKQFYFLPPKMPTYALPKARVVEKKEERKAEASKAAANAEAIAAAKKPDPKKLLEDLTALCRARGIPPADFKVIVASKFDRNSAKDLDASQLEELLHYVESEVR